MSVSNETVRFMGRSAAMMLFLGVNIASAADVYLRAMPYDKVMYDGQVVPMWGFAACDATFTTCGEPSSPGPQINVATGDSLTIHVSNQLPAPVSITVPGQGGGDPVFFTDGMGRQRVRSFTHEVAPGATGTYTYNSLAAGTLLYESGTYPSIQIPMGLYGAIVVGPGTASCADAAQTAAYANDNTCFDSDVVLVYSEVDPYQNEAVAMAANESEYPATISFYASYLLVNGEETATLPSVDPGDTLLLRMLNAGTSSRNPELVGAPMGVLAKDGFLLPGAVQTLSTAELSAGSTLDLLVTVPSLDVTLGLSDRSARSNFSGSPGSLASASVVVGLGTPEDPIPTVHTEIDIYYADEDTTFFGDSVLDNDVGLSGATLSVFSQPSHGTLTLAADGTFVYIPDPDFSGDDSFTYTAELNGSSYPGQVLLSVSYTNDAPVAEDDGTYTNAIGKDIVVEAPGVLGNDMDADGDDLTAIILVPPAAGTLDLAADGSFVFVGGTAGQSYSFTYMTFDGQEYSDPATVTLEVLPVAGIALNVQDASGATVTDYYWTVQEDLSYKVDPASPPAFTDMLSGNFHKSWMPVVATGTTVAGGGDAFEQVALDPTKHYYVSVLPLDGGNEDGSGHSMSGAAILPGAASVDVVLANHPIPTARISVLAFEDIEPVNGVWDAGEPGLSGFQVTIEDAGGRYGQNGGVMSQDVFGNPLRNSLDCFGGAEPPAGVILSCPDGSVVVENLPPGKFGVTVTAPSGQESSWIQTSTIEGTRVVDAWSQAGDPPFMVEWGAGPHVFIGFVNPEHTTVPSTFSANSRRNTITGNVTLFHDPRPPAAFGTTQTGNYDGLSHTQAWIGLNSDAGIGPSYATVQADTNGNFTIPNIPDGDYQLVIWDTFLDQIIDFRAVTLTGSGANLGAVPVFEWFTRLEHNVFLDSNENGQRDAGEAGLPDQNINIRFRDGSMYQSFPTDTEGFVPFDEVFPFFSWQVAEVDFARFKPTGVTVQVDGGGDTSNSPNPGVMSLQTGSPRTETGPVLLEAFQNFPGQTSIMDWGKAPYHVGENGGISGIVYYASTRAEYNPRLSVGDTWERGLPGVKVRLYKEITNAIGNTVLSLVEEVTTDSWDATIPTDCPGETASSPFVTSNLGSDNLSRCYDGWRNYNQMRPGVFDGGYAFVDIPPGDYVVEVEPPPGFELVKEEDVNVGYGDVFDMASAPVTLPGGATVIVVPDMASVVDSTAQPGLAQPPCVGETRTVGDVLSLFPDTMVLSPYAGYERPLCDRKAVHLSDQAQAAADFFLYTPAPIATQFTGLILDDVAIEHDQRSPNYSEKWAPSFLPVSIRDFQGHEVYRTYSDGYGRYNGMAASTYDANIPNPSGYSPAMYQVCLNAAGDDAHPEPYRNENYGEICTVLQFMPGTTTYLDTPVLPSSAFSAGYNPVDCAQPTTAPEIQSVTSGLVVAAGGNITVTSRGLVSVPDPSWRGPTASAPYNTPFITRNYGFGSSTGTVKLVSSTGSTTTLSVTSWADGTVTARVPSSLARGTYQLTLTNSSGVSTITSASIEVGTETPITVSPGQSIQAAIDAAASGALIVVQPGVYEEQLVIWKPVRLQGSGAGGTIIDAAPRPASKLAVWREKVNQLVTDGLVTLLPGQLTNINTAFGGGVFDSEMGAGIIVLAKDGVWDNTASRIDGFTVRNAMVGGGIVVNGYADNLSISNNVVNHNSGWLGGGIRVGAPLLPVTGNGPYGFNPNIKIHHNDISLNAATAEQSAGGGVTLANGTDRYQVTDNFICGNYTTGYGAGIGHLGLSDDALIARNTILFNQQVNPTITRSGGGIFVGGTEPEAPAITPGAGDVTIDRNRIQGNIAATGHGGGIRAEGINGADVEASSSSSRWYALTLTNNIIVNNIAGWAGAGISLQDAVRTFIYHNTIARNDSTATAGPLVNLATGTSTAQPSGIASSLNSAALSAVIPGSSRNYSDPTMRNNIVWQNRSFHVDTSTGTARLLPAVTTPTTDGGCGTGAVYWDMGILGSTSSLSISNSFITSGASGTNSSSDPQFVSSYCNGARELGTPGPMDLAIVIDEAGNNVDLRYGPLTQSTWDYHLKSTSPAVNYNQSSNSTGVTSDIDGDSRPQSSRSDPGADEYRSTTTTVTRGAR